MFGNLPLVSAADLSTLLPMPAAIAAIEDALAAGLDPEADPARSNVPFPAGQMLLMPSGDERYAGVKIATVADHGLPRIRAVYLLLDGQTFAPLALFDGTALTSLRTPAVSAAALNHIARPDASRLLVFGTGPQAEAHVEAVRAIRDIEHVAMKGRNDSRTRKEIQDADIICCCTTAETPLFPGAWVSAGTAVVAIGSHEPGKREVDTDLVAASQVFVESRRAALTEAGDVIQPIGSGVPVDLVTLADLHGTKPDPARPRLFKSVGMGWQDLVVAAAAYEALPGTEKYK
ncbi:ornithine cyclodeaminase family protein [Longispora albida]|uniref:ornithine cyclodeaminase family protein n=1 Tax=Longispora albida TaxID=203523 RepID=UPI000364FDBC|nr:ornithine cyclodeaminase family protein [Longispora albida]